MIGDTSSREPGSREASSGESGTRESRSGDSSSGEAKASEVFILGLLHEVAQDVAVSLRVDGVCPDVSAGRGDSCPSLLWTDRVADGVQ